MQIKDRYKKFNAPRTKSAEDKEIAENAKKSRSDKRIFIG
jgi:hypothetical protein